MRDLSSREIDKRGCWYCLDFVKKIKTPQGNKAVKMCIHPSCPYHELDKYDHYSDYLKTKDTEGLNMILQKIFDLTH